MDDEHLEGEPRRLLSGKVGQWFCWAMPDEQRNALNGTGEKWMMGR